MEGLAQPVRRGKEGIKGVVFSCGPWDESSSLDHGEEGQGRAPPAGRHNCRGQVAMRNREQMGVARVQSATVGSRLVRVPRGPRGSGTQAEGPGLSCVARGVFWCFSWKGRCRPRLRGSLTCTFSFTSLWVLHFPQGAPFAHAGPARGCLGTTFLSLLGFLTLCCEAWMKEAFSGDR